MGGGRIPTAIRGQDTKPERPDIVLRKYRTGIFVNGCYWHGHAGCKYFVLPKTRTDFWKAKMERNRQRDVAVQRQPKSERQAKDGFERPIQIMFKNMPRRFGCFGKIA